jgi:predicted phage tail protein
MQSTRRRLGPATPERLPLRVRLAAARRRAVAGLQRTAGALLAPAPVVAALLLGSVGCAVSGVFILFGLGWSLIAGSIALLLLAAALARGLTNG